MSFNFILSEAKESEKEFVEIRRKIHAHAEVGFELAHTPDIVSSKLREYGYTPETCGRAGVTATVGAETGKCILLRADMDALPIKEETELDFAADNGNMHACGHDMHTAMLLCAAKILKAHESELCGRVKLMFQPAEELFEGAQDMISAGILEVPRVDAALMIHVMAGVSAKPGALVIPPHGPSAPSADHFKIIVRGKACHGSSPQNGVDALLAAAHILVALQEINAREIPMGERAVFTVGKIHAGSAANAIAGEAVMEGTLRSFSEESRAVIKQRIGDIVKSVALAFRADAEAVFGKSCPVFKNDAELCEKVSVFCKDLVGENIISAEAFGASAGGSEDFAYIAERVPAVMLSISAGAGEYPLHHPKVCFDESVIAVGGAVYAYNAMRWLEDGGKGA